MKSKSFLESLKIAAVAMAIFLGAAGVSAATYGTWADPAASAPGGNAAAPISAIGDQTKQGGLIVNEVKPDATYAATGLDVLHGASLFSGNVGIGTTNPAGNLDVTGTSCLNGTCISAWPSATSSQWASSGNDIYYSGGNVGIGTVSPANTLDVAGKISATGFALTSSGANGQIMTSDFYGNAKWSKFYTRNVYRDKTQADFTETYGYGAHSGTVGIIAAYCDQGDTAISGSLSVWNKVNSAYAGKYDFTYGVPASGYYEYTFPVSCGNGVPGYSNCQAETPAISTFIPHTTDSSLGVPNGFESFYAGYASNSVVLRITCLNTQ